MSGIVVLIALEFMTPAFYYIPSAGLAAMILMAVLTMIEISIIKSIWKLHKWDLLPFLVTFCTSFYKLEYGVIAGTSIAILMMLSREARPKYLLKKDNLDKSVTLQLMENLTYPGVDAINKTIFSEVNSLSGIETLYLDMSAFVRIDFTLLKNFEFLRKELSKKKIALFFVNFSRDSVKKKLLNAGLVDGEILTNFIASTMVTKINPSPQNEEAIIEGTAKMTELKCELHKEENVNLSSSGFVEESNNAVKEDY